MNAQGLGWVFPTIDWGGLLKVGADTAVQVAKIKAQTKAAKAQVAQQQAQQKAEMDYMLAQQAMQQQALQAGRAVPTIAPQAGVRYTQGVVQAPSGYAARTGGSPYLVPAALAAAGVAVLLILRGRQ